ncbi:MAG: hypothetical protein EXR14_03980, partial [Pelagibacteraceae bacterium]|nr:hypothetical protein [Pelagibacteraceae bacterium]
MKKIIFIFIFIFIFYSTLTFAEKIERLGLYNIQELLEDDNLTFKTASLWGAQYEAKILKKDHDIVIIDTPPKIESDARPSIEAAD